MKTIEMNGITLTLTEETADQLKAELEQEREEKRLYWITWNWYARRWAMYGSLTSKRMFSDLYKQVNGFRPTHMTSEDVFNTLYRDHCRAAHGKDAEWYRSLLARLGRAK